jgi:GNAT superfamily N-acetyltransferase
MEIVKFNDNQTAGIVDLWNSSCANETPYKPFTGEGFISKFIKNPHFDYEGTFAAFEDGRLVGFANSIYKKEFLPGETFQNTPGYVTFILVHKDYRRRGYGTMLLKRVEEYLSQSGKKRIHMDFFNPINLEWYVPGTRGHDHPNAPGVDMDGLGYEFVKKNGYAERTREVSMYLDLSRFEIDEAVRKKILELEHRGIELGYYDPGRHFGFDGLFDDLKHELWRKEIKDNNSLKNPYPVIIASDKGRICGFTGPIQVQESGRGLFSGIGVDSAHQGFGIGKVLFFMLCDSFRKEGAGFMSIFTGMDNNAKKMYDAAGFKVVKTWALFRKEI